jgi:tetrahydromethanopterin S-methyltransferase subunit G
MPVFPTPTLVEDAEYAVEAAVLGEADVVRLQRRLDELEGRLQTVELRLANRVYRKVSGTTRRVLGRGRERSVAT